MSKLDWDRAAARQKARESRVRTSNPSTWVVTIRARYPSECHTCARPIDVGDRIVSTIEQSGRRFSHARCIHKNLTQSGGPGDQPETVRARRRARQEP